MHAELVINLLLVYTYALGTVIGKEISTISKISSSPYFESKSSDLL